MVPLKKISYQIKKHIWIASVSLKSNFKNKIAVTIEEANPIGVFFNGTNYLLIDDFGEVIDFIDEKNTFKYIKFFGENARINVVKLINRNPFFSKAIN